VIALPIRVYHFTHRDNLELILARGFFECDRTCKAGSLTRRNIGYANLKQRRLNTVVEVPPGGTVGDYVPFYFGTQSPMLYAYEKGRVTGKPEDQDEIIYFATTAERIVTQGYQFVFTDGHPVQEPKAFYNDLARIGEVDLPLMTQKYWFDTDSDPDRARRRQAEFLVRERFAWEHVWVIGVRTQAMREWVEHAVRDTPYKPSCIVRPEWYYD